MLIIAKIYFLKLKLQSQHKRKRGDKKNQLLVITRLFFLTLRLNTGAVETAKC